MKTRFPADSIPQQTHGPDVQASKIYGHGSESELQYTERCRKAVLTLGVARLTPWLLTLMPHYSKFRV